jgi:hypothetical protein
MREPEERYCVPKSVDVWKLAKVLQHIIETSHAYYNGCESYSIANKVIQLNTVRFNLCL